MKSTFRLSVLYNKQEILNLLVFGAILILLLSYFKPDLILLDTTTSGGDTGSHNYPLWYLKNNLLPEGRLTGWSPGWYAGFPMFQFYFVLPFLLMTAISYILPLWISFKIVTILGTFLLPIAAFFSMKLMKFKFPVPIFAALLTLPFLFMEANSMWGGNIPSTLAGEFSYSLSLAFTVLFIGALYRSVKIKPRSTKLVLLSSILLSLALLCHIYTSIFAVFTSLFFLLVKSRKEFFKRLYHLFKVYILAFMLCAFWAVPLIAKMTYATPYHYVWNLKGIMEVFPIILAPFILLAFFGAYKGLKKFDNRILYLLFSLLVSFTLYNLAPTFGLTDIRFIPMLQLFPMFIAAYFISDFVKKVRLSWIPVIILTILVIWWVGHNVKYIDYWIRWNYEGFQSKQYWGELDDLMSYLDHLPEGRVVHEYSNSHDKYGTPRTLENTPLFSGKPTLEGLNIESALSAPYVFMIQAEISSTSTCPIPGLKCGGFNITKAERHLESFNIHHIIATTPKLKNAIRDSTDWQLLESFGDLSVYEVGNVNYVEPINYKPILLMDYSDWKELSLEWFRDSEYMDVPIVFTETPDGVDSSIRFNPAIDSLEEIERVPLDGTCSVLSEEVTDNEIKIRTDCIGRPLLVKMSYFPNWQVEGADRIYMASPSFMMLFPDQEDVRLYYGYTWIDYVSYILSVFGIATIILILILGKIKSQKIYKHLR